MPTYPSSVSEVEQPETEVSSGRSSKRPPKGILKNANPNASYHKHGSSSSRHKMSGMNKRIEDLIEYERPRSSPPQRHVCDDGDDFEDEMTIEENSSSSSPSSPSSTVTSEVSSRRHSQSKTSRDSSSSDHRHGHHHAHKSKHRSHRSSRSGS
jgi:hypothetical protein